jgi:predicted CXXCH cytochrome family protein
MKMFQMKLLTLTIVFLIVGGLIAVIENVLVPNNHGSLLFALGTEFVAGDADEALMWDGSANVVQTVGDHNVYKTGGTIGSGVGFGKWCSTCHTDFHGDDGDTNVNDTSDWIRHPTAYALPSGYITNYGATYDITFPLETNNGSASTSTAWTLVQGNEGVMCLTCHKAHASTNPNMTRWDNSQPSGTGTGCNRCHNKGA